MGRAGRVFKSVLEAVEFAVSASQRQIDFAPAQEARRQILLTGEFKWLTRPLGSGIAQIQEGERFEGMLKWRFPYRLHLVLPKLNYLEFADEILGRNARLCSIFSSFESSSGVDWISHGECDWPLVNLQLVLSDKAG